MDVGSVVLSLPSPSQTTFRQCQEVRVGSLDHAYHDMRENREPANTDMDQAIPRLAGIAPPTGRRIPFLFHKNSHFV